jgi:hypothetical protein
LLNLFLFFIAVAKEIVFLFSLLNSSLSVYRSISDLCVDFVSYKWLNLFINSNKFLVESLEFSMYKIISSANRNNLTLPSPVWTHFHSFSCLIALTSITLKKCGKSKHPCFVPDLWEKISTFHSSEC